MITQSCDPRHDDVGAGTRLLLLLAGLASGGLAVMFCLQPAAALPWPLAPLHAACIGALQAAIALPWILAAREQDSAALRIPLAQMLASSGMSVLLAVLHGVDLVTPRPLAWAWLAAQVVWAAFAGAWLVRRSDVPAPAERPDRALQMAAAVLGVGALALAFAPELVARVWPWPMGHESALLYGSGFAGWAVALMLLARERRRHARRLALWGVSAMGCLVTLASIWHWKAFHQSAAGAAWVASFMTLSLLAWKRLAGAGLRRLRAWIRPVRPSDR